MPLEICAVGTGIAYKGVGKHRCVGDLRVQHTLFAAIKPLRMLASTLDGCCVLLCEGYVEFLAV